MKYETVWIGTTPEPIVQTPANYSIYVDDFYVSNPGTIAVNLSIGYATYTYNKAADSTIVSTIITPIANFMASDITLDVNEEDALRFPAGAYIYGSVPSGSVSFTYSRRYIFYRE